MSTARLTRHYVVLGALRWAPVGLVLPFMVITPEARGLSLGAIGAVLAVHSAVTMLLEVPSGALADTIGRRRVMLAGAALTAFSLLVFAAAQSIAAFAASTGLLAAGRAMISGALEAWYVDSLRSIDPLAPLARGLSRGTAAEAIGMAAGSLLGGALVAVAGPGAGAFSGYGIAALAGAVAALVYFVAVAVLVREPAPSRPDERESIGRQTREVVATARAEAAASVTVRVVFATGIALGVSLTAVELLWQPRLADLLGNSGTEGFVFGALAAASMLAVAAGAGLSPVVARRLGLQPAYVTILGVGAVCVAVLGAPASPLAFAAVYLLAYALLGVAEPMHYELLNDAVGSKARATLMSAESFATQSGSLVANLGLGAFAAAQGVGATWVLAGVVLGATCAAIARPLLRTRGAPRAAAQPTPKPLHPPLRFDPPPE